MSDLTDRKQNSLSELTFPSRAKQGSLVTSLIHNSTFAEFWYKDTRELRSSIKSYQIPPVEFEARIVKPILRSSFSWTIQRVFWQGLELTHARHEILLSLRTKKYCKLLSRHRAWGFPFCRVWGYLLALQSDE